MPALVKRFIRVGLLAGSIGLGALGSAPGYAGPINQYPIAGSATEDGGRHSETMLDPIRCTPVRGRHAQNDPGQAACPDVYAGSDQGKGSRRPGPSAFGLQFDSGDY